MRERYYKTKYSFAKTAFVNMYYARRVEAIGAAHALYLLKKHEKLVPVVDGPFTKGVDEEGRVPMYIMFKRNDGGKLLGAVDVAEQVHSMINNYRPNCLLSWICTMVKNSGLITEEELAMLIDHKMNYVKSTKRGRKIVLEYNRLGSVIEKRMLADLKRDEVYRKVYDDWLASVVVDVREGRFDEAEVKYMQAVDWLCTRYGMKRHEY